MRLLTSLLILLVATQLTTAQSNTSNIFRFLELTPTAASAALGGNHVAVYDGDFSLIHLNPAYLGEDDSGHASASYINFLADVNMGFTSMAYDLGSKGMLAAGIRYVGYGEFDRLDEDGNNLGNFSANDVSLTGAYSIILNENLRAGGALDVIYSSYATFKSMALAVSGGVYYQDETNNFSAGISVRNVGTQVKAFDDNREPLPLDISAGISKKPEAFPFQLILTLKQLNNWDMRIFGETERPTFANNLFRHVLFGGETNVAEVMRVRLGYDHYLHEQTKTGKNFDLAGLAFGIGFDIKNFTFDLSRNSYSKLGGITRLSIKTSIFEQ
ncbi:type IX secretion system protein PorQ [Gracilimonas sp.]|uniref:type IX secretion system protein PorQ n=1 Tax=Gracilimonas sp. TaxID=1974203 RepID=UPI002872794A|nr:type IX secretion system protein PorQ [Gracilimonas sp.]